MTSLAELRFFNTPAHDCSYLDGKEAVTLFADPLARVNNDLYSRLSSIGFRRSGNHIYRPNCQNCSACIPVRIPVRLFEIKRRFRRILKRNEDITFEKVTPELRDEYFSLYDRYLASRHSDGDMYPASPEQFQSFLVSGHFNSNFVEFRSSRNLLAVAVIDELNDGLSAVYSFFDPDEEARAPGILAILKLIEETQRLGLNYLYLGYWIKQSAKMNYKLDFKPIELYINNKWVRSEV